MQIKIKVHANSSKEDIKEISYGYEVWVKEKPIQGKVNAYLLKMLKKHLGKSVRLKSGATSRNKVFDVLD